MKAFARTQLPGTVSLGLVLTGLLFLTRVWGEEAPAEGVALRPLWHPGKSYRLQQRIEATAEIPGLGEPAFGWHQLMTVKPLQTAKGLALDLALEVVRVDLDFEGERSRYYFRPGEAKRYQEGRGFPGTLLGDLERLVDRRCRLSVDDETGLARIAVSPADGDRPDRAEAIEADAEEDLRGVLRFLPWEGLTNALLHQGIPEEPKSPGDMWRHRHRLAFQGAEGHLQTDLECRFDGYKTIQDRKLALIAFEGSIDLRLEPATDIAASENAAPEEATPETGPRIDLDVPRIKGLTLIDPQQRAIVSTVIKVDGKVKQFGQAEFAGRQAASFENTITLSLLAVEDLPE